MRRRSGELSEDVVKNAQLYLEAASVIDEAQLSEEMKVAEMYNTGSGGCDMDIEGILGRRTDGSRHGRIDLV